MTWLRDLTTRLALGLVFGVYFGVVVFVELVKVRQVPEAVQMLVTRRNQKMQTEVRINGKPTYVAGVPTT